MILTFWWTCIDESSFDVNASVLKRNQNRIKIKKTLYITNHLNFLLLISIPDRKKYHWAFI